MAVVDAKQQEIKVQYVDPNTLRPHPDAEAIPMSKEDEQALYNGIAQDGIKTPLHTTPDGQILDGIHRWKFSQKLGIALLPVIIYHYQHPEEESLHALKANFQRRHINEGQKGMLKIKMASFQQKLEQFREQTKERKVQLGREAANKRWHNTQNNTPDSLDGLVPQGTNPSKESGKSMVQVAKIEGVSPRTMYRAQAVSKADPKRAEAVLKGEISLTKAYQEVKAEEKVQEVKKLQEAQHPLTDLEIMQKLGIPVYPYDVWNFPTCDDRFGHDYPGRVPGQLVAQCLYFWTEQGDLVVDPMAGSGTTIDVCKALNRHVLAYDAHPCREDITQCNLIMRGWPDGTAEAKLIFWDPPYFKKMDDRYGEESISRYTRSEYLDFFVHMARTIPAGFHGRLAFLMSDYTDDNIDGSIWFTDYANIFTGCGWRIERYIQTPLTSQSVHPDIVNKFRTAKRLARLGRVLMVVSR